MEDKDFSTMLEEQFVNRTNLLYDKSVIWRHFKGNIYRILCIANHTEHRETLVIYQRIRDDGTLTRHVCARPVKMFLSTVDLEKYPDATQTFRFEAIKEEEYENNKN